MEFYYKLGSLIAKHPWIFLSIGIIVPAILSIFIKDSETLTDVTDLWVKKNSQLEKDIEYRDIFVPDALKTDNEILITVTNPRGGDVLNTEVLTNLLEVSKRVNALNVTVNGHLYTLKDLCDSPLPYVLPCTRLTVLDCFKEGGFDFPSNILGFDPYVIRSSFLDPSTDIHKVVSEGCFLWTGTIPVLEELTIGGITKNVNGTVLKADSFESLWRSVYSEKLPSRVKNDRFFDPHEITQTEADDIFDKLYTKFVEIGKLETSESKTLGFSSSSFDMQIEDFSKASTLLLIVSFIILFLYAGLAFFKKSLILSKSSIGIAGVIIVCISIAGTFGLSALFGIKYNATSLQVLPFLLLGIGLNDMFIITRSFKLENSYEEDEEVCGSCLKFVGKNITLTSICNFTAFMLGTLTPLPVVIDFSYMAAIGIVFNFFTILFTIPALLTLKLRCVRDNRWDLLCCYKTENFADEEDVRINRMNTMFTTKYATFIFNYTKLLQTFKCRLIFLVLFSLIIGASIYGITQIEKGIEQKDFFNKGDDEYELLDIRFDDFGTWDFTVSTKEFDYPSKQKEMIELFHNVENSTSKHVIPGGTLWLEAFIFWGFPNQPGSLNFSCTINSQFIYDEIDYYRCLDLWLKNDPSASLLNPRLPVDINGNLILPIKYSEMGFYSLDLIDTQDYIDLIEEVREKIDSSSFPAFPMGVPFIFWQHYIGLEKLLWRNISIVIGAIFIILTIAQLIDKRTLKTSVGISLTLCALIYIIILQVYGFMGIFNIKLSGIPIVSLIMLSGFAVEYLFHIFLIFMSSVGSRSERLRNALHSMFLPVVDGAVSTILGVSMIAFSSFEFIFKYFFLFYLIIILFCSFTGLFVLPIVLGMIGPENKRRNNNNVIV